MRINVIKIGGNVVEDGTQLESFIKDFALMEGPKILVHGGGTMASDIQKKLGLVPQMVQGRRITDEESLKVVTMVYAGWCNKNIVALLQKYGCMALGLSGADNNLIEAVKRPPKEIVRNDGSKELIDYGFAGDISPDKINASILMGILSQNTTPVLCAITHDGKGNLLNTNADTIACDVAIAMCAWCDEVSMTLCFEKDGVLFDKDDESSVIGNLTPEAYGILKRNGRVADGMLPKLDNAFRALENGVKEVMIKSSKNILNDYGTTLKLK